MQPKPKICAIIPARGGSKSIPRKNLAPLHGKPLIAYSIEHAKRCPRVDRVIVSTEDAEIAETAKRFGAEVPFLRPRELAADSTLDFPVFEHALKWLETHDGYRPEIVLHLRPTAPLRRPEHLEEAIELLRNTPEADSVRSVSAPSQHPYRMFTIAGDGFLAPLLKTPYPEPFLLRRQELPPVYWYNCVVDVTRWSTVMTKASMTGSRILPYVMDARFVVDIDSPDDLLVAEAKLLAGEEVSIS